MMLALCKCFLKSDLKMPIMVYENFQWILFSFKIVVRKCPIVSCGKVTGTNLITSIQMCKHVYVFSICVDQAQLKILQPQDEFTHH